MGFKCQWMWIPWHCECRLSCAAVPKVLESGVQTQRKGVGYDFTGSVIRILWVPTKLFKLVHSQIVSIFFSLTHMPDSFICRTWRHSNWFKVLQPCLSITTSFLPLAFSMAGETTLSILELKFLHRFFLTNSAMYFTDSCLSVPGWFISFPETAVISPTHCESCSSSWLRYLTIGMTFWPRTTVPFLVAFLKLLQWQMKTPLSGAIQQPML